MPGSQADVDGVAIALRWLQAHPRVLALPWLNNDPTRISGELTPPYPRIKIDPLPSPVPPEPYHIWHQDLQVAAVDAATPRAGSAALRVILVTVLEALRDLPAIDVPDPTLPVVTSVTATAGPAPIPDLGGHARWVCPVRVTYHLPAVSA